MDAPAGLEQARVVLDAYRTVTKEHDCALDVVRGALPEGLRGVLYRNGPGRVRIGDDVYGHPFDGDGMILRVAFDGSGARYRNRYVRTRELVAEEAAGRMLFRAFGTNLPGGPLRNALRLRFKNAANTNVIRHGGRLLALWEGGLPHALDPDSLETLGRFDYDGALRAAAGRSWIERALVPELPFAAHPRVDPDSGELHGFGVVYGRRDQLLLYRVSAAGVLTRTESVPLDRVPFVHDLALTARHRVFFLTPVLMDTVRFTLGVASPAEAITQEADAPTRILVVPRDGAPPIVLEAPPCFVFHLVNAFDDGDRVVVDALRMDGYPEGEIDFDDPWSLTRLRYPPPRPTRFVLDLDRREVTTRELSDLPMELPTIHPGRVARRHRYAWAQAARDFDTPFMSGVAKLDAERADARYLELAPDLPGEPLFVPRPGADAEDDGWVLTVVYRAEARRSDLVILDAWDLSEVAILALPHHVPPGFHGSFVPSDQGA